MIKIQTAIQKQILIINEGILMMIQKEPEEEQQTNSIEESIETLQQALDEEKGKSENYLASWQRAQADFINFKRRNEQEKSEISELAKSALILNLLPVLDDMERAFTSLPDDLAEISWLDGIKIVERKLKTTLKEQGLSTIKALGEQFDPHLHEAIRQEKGEEGIIIEEVQKGYIFKDKVLRPSIVVVGNGEIEGKKKTKQAENKGED
ncbi:nucleotide exchange factor GrpE [Chloroflexota bacterium]